jgi:hypothetical protein
MAHSSDPDNITFSKLEDRLLNANENIDSQKNYQVLDTIKEPTVSIGTGGSFPVAIFGSKVLTKKGLISINATPRDAIYNLKGINNLVAYSWSGSTHGVLMALQKYPNSILVHANEQSLHNKEIRLYHENMDKENSFISEATTLIPMGEMLKYYLHKQGINERDYLKYLIQDIFYKNHISENVNSEVFEIMTGDDTNTASHILESTMVEAGIALPVLHEKYEYCHGRSVTSSNNKEKHTLIYLINQETDFDKMLLALISHNYKNVITLRANHIDRIVGEYILALKSVLLCNYIAKKKNMTLSQVDYDPSVVKKLYRYKGEL